MTQKFALSWEIEGEKQLSRNLLLLADRIQDWTPAFRETAIDLKSVFESDVFKSEGGAIGEHWSPLSAAYAYKKAQKYPGKGILEATGRMRSGFMMEFKSNYAKVWNDIEYFKYHQSNKPRSKLPRRVMMKLGNAQKNMVVKIFHSYFHEIVNK